MILYRSPEGPLLEHNGKHYALAASDWDALINHDDLVAWLRSEATATNEVKAPAGFLAPIGSQEVWASGVTYYRSRNARMDESEQAGGADFYARVYEADRPELFFKANPNHVVGPHVPVRIRADSRWSVPEPEIALVMDGRGALVGYTIGNDMSARDIEGDNPLYLPQAKVYNQACALGPVIVLADGLDPASLHIQLQIERQGQRIFEGETSFDRLKRDVRELMDYLWRENDFPNGVFLLTGTGIVPPDDISLQDGDVVSIHVAGIGTLRNPVTQRG